MTSYDFRNRVAAKMDLYSKWRDIVDKYRKQEAKDFEGLLKSAVPYLRSVGYDLILSESYLDRYNSGSDGVRIEGLLVIRDRDENTVKSIEFGERDGARRVRDWVDEALNMYGTVKYKGDNVWIVDITAS